MAVKQLLNHHLFQVKDAAKGFLISLKASSRYSPGYLGPRYAYRTNCRAIGLVTTPDLVATSTASPCFRSSSTLTRRTQYKNSGSLLSGTW